jgi:cell division septation protein DedD
VLVGPKAYKADAARLKQQLDREMKTQSMLKPFAAK